MSGPFFMIRSKHTPTGNSEPPAITNAVEGQCHGYYENLHGEHWAFVY